MWKGILSAAAVLGFAAALHAEGPSPGTRGHYAVLSGTTRVAPPVAVVDILSGPVESAGGREAVWWQLEARAQDAAAAEPLFQIQALTSRHPLANADQPLDFHRYLLRLPATGEALEYRNIHTKRALLPPWRGVLASFFPRPTRRCGFREGWAETGAYLGHALTLQDVQAVAAWKPMENVKVLDLDPELLVGASRNIKDTEGRRLPQTPEKQEYHYVPFDEADCAAMIQAGFNLFTLAPEQDPYVRAKPVFYLRGPGGNPPLRVPADLYRSNYIGSEMFMDEPATLMVEEEPNVKYRLRPGDASAVLQMRVRQAARAPGNGARALERQLAQQGFNFGDMRLEQAEFPVWETIYDTTFYQMAGGGSGLVHEGRYRLDWFDATVAKLAGIARKHTAGDILRYHYAFLRGGDASLRQTLGHGHLRPMRSRDRPSGPDPGLRHGRALPVVLDLGPRSPRALARAARARPDASPARGGASAAFDLRAAPHAGPGPRHPLRHLSVHRGLERASRGGEDPAVYPPEKEAASAHSRGPRSKAGLRRHRRRRPRDHGIPPDRARGRRRLRLFDLLPSRGYNPRMPDLRSRNAFPRIPTVWLPPRFDAGDWKRIGRCFHELASRPIRSREAAERWLRGWSELAAALSQEEARRYIETTCRTDDAKAEASYLAFQRGILPKVKPCWHALRTRYIALPARRSLPRRRYAVFDRAVANEAAIYRKKNIPLETREAELAQRYQKLMGAMTVRFGGRERTLPQMGRYLEVRDARVRREAWTLVADRYLRDRGAVDAIYDRLVSVRDRVARNAGFRDYRDYAFRMHGRFDYGPRECFAYHKAVERVVVPALRRLHERRRILLQQAALRPWDLHVDLRGGVPLRPFESGEELFRGVREIYRRISPDLAGTFQAIRSRGLLDLESRKGKAPGGYQQTLDADRVPFIFMNAAGLHRDVETLLHEGGHAFHAVWSRSDPLLAYRHAPIEFCEVASQGMEVLGLDHLEVFYAPADAARARRKFFEEVVSILAWIAQIDAFQHWVYTHPAHSREARDRAWLALRRRFMGDIDWTGHEDAHSALWHRQLHLFSHPFYYIEYGISLIGALQLWRNARRDRAGAIRKYRAALALGGSRPLPELYRAAGLRFDFTERMLRPLVAEVMRELE